MFNGCDNFKFNICQSRNVAGITPLIGPSFFENKCNGCDFNVTELKRKKISKGNASPLIKQIVSQLLSNYRYCNKLFLT